ncbi:MAG: GNAT family N-acetyltransferase [Gemmatimonadaceae bacterium]
MSTICSVVDRRRTFSTTSVQGAVVTLILETARLRLRQFQASDIDAYAELCADPEVMRYLGPQGPLSREDAWRQLSLWRGHWELRGYGMWAVEERATRAFVGRVGLHYPEGWPDHELGWALSRSFWGRGYAYEAAKAALTIAFVDLRWSRIVSLIDPSNQRSIRLAGRLGESFESEIQLRGSRVALYALTRAEWSVT